MLAQCAYFGFRIGELSCPAKYFAGASSSNFRRSLKYGLGVLATSLQYRLQHMGVLRLRIFNPKGRTLGNYYKQLISTSESRLSRSHEEPAAYWQSLSR
jgi:hypothetical protein